MGSVVDISSAKTRASLNQGDGGGTFDNMEIRVKALEADMKTLLQDTAEIKGLLRGLPTASDIGELKGRVAALPSATEFGELKGRVNALPTTAKVATLMTILGTAITIVLKWQELKSFLF